MPAYPGLDDAPILTDTGSGTLTGIGMLNYGFGYSGTTIPTVSIDRVEATAATQELATKAAQLSRQPFLHHGVPEWMGGITSFACLHNPAHIDRGAVYRFNLNHVAVPRTKTEMFRTEFVDLGGPRR